MFNHPRFFITFHPVITLPATVVADANGTITDRPGLAAAGRNGFAVEPLAPESLIPLPAQSRLFLLPGRSPAAIAPDGKIKALENGGAAVAAFLPPGYVALSLAAYSARPGAPALPLYCYCALCWFKGKFHVPALRIDHDQRHCISPRDQLRAEKAVGRWIKKYPGNRLVAHHGINCVKKYACPNAVNLFLRRREAPVAVSGGCNAACLGCISRQESCDVRAPMRRIDFTPSVRELLEIAAPHLEKAPRAIVSFGQGCEGEPLLKADLIAQAIRAIRRRTKRGMIHLNTNGSIPGAVAKLAEAGLNSIRISLNSARPELYAAYYRPRGYFFKDVVESFHVARRAGLLISANYLTFPGITDTPAEYRALCGLLEKDLVDMIQWRNLNIDPEIYLETVRRACPGARRRPLGLQALMERIHRQYPGIKFGYFNPSAQPV